MLSHRVISRSHKCLDAPVEIIPHLSTAAIAVSHFCREKDAAAFNTLLNELIAEYGPQGRSEKDIVETMARLIWRKKIYRPIGWQRGQKADIPRSAQNFSDPHLYLVIRS